jgi:hypothetical protein
MSEPTAFLLKLIVTVVMAAAISAAMHSVNASATAPQDSDDSRIHGVAGLPS